MTVQASPTLTVDGTTIPATRPAGGTLVGVDTLRIGWGRDSMLSRPTPATADLTVRDTSLDASFARRTDLIGRPVLLGWSATPDVPGQPATTGINFRGRITDVVATPRRAGGFDVALSCSSKEVDAANYTVPAGTVWPAETFADRLARIVGVLPLGFFAGGVAMPDAPTIPDGWPAAQQDVSGADALALIRQFYDSVGPQPAQYDPDGDRITWAPRRNFTVLGARGALSAGLVTDPARAGRYVVRPLSGVTWGLGLDARQIDYTGSLTQPMDSRITQVEVSYKDSTAGYAQRTATAQTALAGDEYATGRRTLGVDSIHASTANAVTLAAAWAAVASAEGHAPRLDPLLYGSHRNDGFDTGKHAAALLAGAEGSARLFLRSSWLPALRTRPLVGVLGATTSYTAGAWSVQFTPAPISTDVDTLPLRVAYSARPGIRLADLDPSVTVGDLRFVDIGAGFTFDTQPPWG
jgi:hypothetical protein